jgi:hypothetical protein
MIFTDCRKVNEYVTNIDPMIFEQLRQFGHSQVPRTRYPTVKKRVSKPKKIEKSAQRSEPVAA